MDGDDQKVTVACPLTLVDKQCQIMRTCVEFALHTSELAIHGVVFDRGKQSYCKSSAMTLVFVQKSVRSRWEAM
jgi:hypothetical protein